MTNPKWSKTLHTNLNWVLKVEAEEQITHLRTLLDEAVGIVTQYQNGIRPNVSDWLKRVEEVLDDN